MNLQDILSSFDTGTNVAKFLKKEKLREIADEAILNYERDKRSRLKWEEKYDIGMKLALQVYEKKNTPWPNAANVKLPLITIPCLQFSSRVYLALINDTEIVKMRVIGPDPEGRKTARARRVSTHMSYQVLEEDEDWEAEMDSLLVTLPLLGSAFKKTYFDPEKEHNCSKHVFAKDLVINYYARSLESALCITHVLTKYRNEIEECQRLELYLEDDKLDDVVPEDRFETLDQSRDDREGLIEPEDGERPFTMLEQHCYLDLDGDGYKEPYCIQINYDTRRLVRIFPRFTAEHVTYVNGKVAKIKPIHYFTKYTFIPSPDGSVYDLGFFALLTPINEACNTIVNQLIDAGTLRNRPGGFIGRGARITGGALKFQMGEFKQINASGDDIRRALFPMQFPEPSTVLFSLLDLLIKYGERISSVTEMMTGETPGQNTPATTAMAALEQGEKVFTGIYKRIYRSMRGEFRKQFTLNKLYLNPEQYFEVLDTGEPMQIFQEDYEGDPTDIRPTADPSVVSSAQRLAKAEALAARSMQYHGYNRHAIEKRYCEALQIPALEEVLPAEPPPQPPSPDQVELEQEKALKQEEFQIKRGDQLLKKMEIDSGLAVKQSQAILNIAKAEAEEAGPQIEIYKAHLQDLQKQREAVNKHETQ